MLRRQNGTYGLTSSDHTSYGTNSAADINPRFTSPSNEISLVIGACRTPAAKWLPPVIVYVTFYLCLLLLLMQTCHIWSDAPASEDPFTSL